MAFKFEKLEVWKDSLEFGYKIHELTRSFPKEELYIMTSQIKRAADSITLNIAEGSTGQSNAVFKQFINYAIRSAIEVVSCLHISIRRKLLGAGRFNELYSDIEILIKRLQALKQALK